MTDNRVHTGETDEMAGRAGQRPFTTETVVPSDFFDRLLEDFDEDFDEDALVAPALARAVDRLRSAPRLTRR